jgi:hypothetical protein
VSIGDHDDEKTKSTFDALVLFPSEQWRGPPRSYPVLFDAPSARAASRASGAAGERGGTRRGGKRGRGTRKTKRGRLTRDGSEGKDIPPTSLIFCCKILPWPCEGRLALAFLACIELTYK